MTQYTFRKTWTIYYILTFGWLMFNYLYQGGANIIVCPFRLITGLPCPGCGITRATLLCLHGNIYEALILNANFILVIGFLCCSIPLFIWDLCSGFIHKLFLSITSSRIFKRSFHIFIILELIYWFIRIIYIYL